MKTIKYRQYHYDEGYTSMELTVPDQCSLYEINCISLSHKVKDTRTTAYVLLCPTNFENSILIGNVYINTIDDIFITDSEIPILDIEDSPKFNGVYSFTYCNDSYIRDQINSVSMLRKLTKSGIEISKVQFKDWNNGKDIFYISIIEIPYGRIFFEEFSSDPYFAKLFLDQSTRIYKYIANNG